MDWGTLNDLLECSVCLDRLDTSSKVLPCQHTFCWKCLQKLYQKQKRLQCPDCRVIVNIRIEDLPPNVLLMRILEGMKNSGVAVALKRTQKRTSIDNCYVQKMDGGTLNDLLECSVCLDRLDTSSKVLPCQHTFCWKCLQKLYQKQKRLQCPDCRVIVNIRIEDLPPNVLLMRILEGMKNSGVAVALKRTQKRTSIDNCYVQKMDGGTLNDLLECSVCLDRLDTSSKVLPCQHTFCWKCLQKLYQKQKRLQCPDCRVIVNIRIEDLPPNVLLMRILEGMKNSGVAVALKRTQKPSSKGSSQHHPAGLVQQSAHIQHQNVDRSNNKHNAGHTTVFQQPYAKALYGYFPKKPGYLSFKKGEVIILKRKIDVHWYQGECGGKQGVFPLSYVQIITPVPSDISQCKGLYDFRMSNDEKEGCLAFNKGDVINVIRRVDEDWAEGKLDGRIGIFPLAFVEMNSVARSLMKLSTNVQPGPSKLAPPTPTTEDSTPFIPTDHFTSVTSMAQNVPQQVPIPASNSRSNNVISSRSSSTPNMLSSNMPSSSSTAPSSPASHPARTERSAVSPRSSRYTGFGSWKGGSAWEWFRQRELEVFRELMEREQELEGNSELDQEIDRIRELELEPDQELARICEQELEGDWELEQEIERIRELEFQPNPELEQEIERIREQELEGDWELEQEIERIRELEFQPNPELEQEIERIREQELEGDWELEQEIERIRELEFQPNPELEQEIERIRELEFQPDPGLELALEEIWEQELDGDWNNN